MVKRVLQVGIVAFVLVTGFAATCQNVDHSLPDAPSVQSAAPSQKTDAFFAEGRSPLEPGATVGVNLMQADAFAATPAEPGEKQPKTVFDKYLARGSSKLCYHHPSSSGLMSRATYAASRVLVTRDDSGKGRLNTSYLLRALASTAADTASRPYWRRPIGQPFSDFGSTVGNDAGTNLWHEFRPGIKQIMKSHTPRFVSRIEARVGHN